MGIKFNALLPELYVSDFQKSLHFYTKIIGFKIEYTRENPSFAFLSLGDAQFMIQQIDPHEKEEYVTGSFDYPLGRGINFQIDVKDVTTIRDNIINNEYKLRRDLYESWYKEGDVFHGCRQILVQDPDGYLLRFSQGIGEKPAV